MITVRAKHWLNYNGTWYKGGETFEIDPNDKDAVAQYVTVIGEFVSDVFPPEEPKAEQPAPTPKRRGRPKKS